MNFTAILNNPKTAASHFETLDKHISMTSGDESIYGQSITVANQAEDKKACFTIRKGDMGFFSCYVQLYVMAEGHYYGGKGWKETKWMSFDCPKEAQAYLNKKAKQFAV